MNQSLRKRKTCSIRGLTDSTAVKIPDIVRVLIIFQNKSLGHEIGKEGTNIDVVYSTISTIHNFEVYCRLWRSPYPGERDPFISVQIGSSRFHEDTEIT